MGSHQRGAETLLGAGMGYPRAGPSSSGQAEERFREGGSRVEPGWRDQRVKLVAPPFHCCHCGTLSDAPLFLYQPG